MQDAKEIGERIKRLRGNESRAAVADACDISVSARSMYECGQRIPRDEIKIKLANYFKKSVESIFLIDNATKCVNLVVGGTQWNKRKSMSSVYS